MASGVADVHQGQDHDPLGETIAEKSLDGKTLGFRRSVHM